jgi:hypothetical protein
MPFEEFELEFEEVLPAEAAEAAIVALTTRLVAKAFIGCLP